MKKEKRTGILRKSLKIASKTLTILLVTFLLFIATLNIPAVQTFITGKISNQFSQQLNTDLSIGAVKIVVPKTILLQDVFLSDLNADTLLYVHSIKVNISLFGLLWQKINISYLEIKNLKGNIFRGSRDGVYNFDFLIRAFANNTPQSDATPEAISDNSWGISVDRIVLSKIKARFRDEFTGMDAILDLGYLEINPKALDLETPGIFVEDILLENTYAKIVEWKVEKAHNKPKNNIEPETLKSPSFIIPMASLDLLTLNNVKFIYMDSSSNLNLDFDVTHLKLEPEYSDLPNKKVVLNKLDISGIKACIALASDTSSSAYEPDSLLFVAKVEYPDAFAVLPGWEMNLKKLNMERAVFEYKDVNVPKTKTGIDFNHLLIDTLNLQIDNILLSDQLSGFNIKYLKLHEQSGLVINQLTMQAGLTKNTATVKKLKLKTGKSHLNGNFNAKFGAFGELINNPGNVFVNINFRNSSINSNDIFLIASINPTDSLLMPYNNLDINLQCDLVGKVDSLNIKLLNLTTLSRTKVVAHGQLLALTTPDKLNFNFSIDSLFTGKNDLVKLVDSINFSGINIPDSVFITLAANGKPDSINADLLLFSDFGDLAVKGFYQSEKNMIRDTFHVNIKPLELQAGKILAIDSLGKINGNVTAWGSGINTDSVSAQVDGKIHKVFFNNYNYSNISFNAQMNGMSFGVLLNSDDPGANFDIEGDLKIDSSLFSFNSNINIELLNLYDLNFIKEKIGLKSRLSFQGKYTSLNDLEARIQTANSELIWDNSVLIINPVSLHPLFTPNSTRFSIHSDLVNLDFESNISFDEMENVMTQAAKKYFGTNDSVQLPPDKHINFDMNVNLTRDFKSHFLSNLNEVRLDSIAGSYNSDNNLLELNLNAPVISYDKINVNNFYLRMSGLHDSLLISAGYDNLSFDTLFTGSLSIHEMIKNGKINSRILINDQEGKSDYLFENYISVSGDSYKISFAENGLVINGMPWLVKPGNYLKISDSAFIAKDFIFMENDQKISFESSKQNYTIQTENFELSNLLNIIKNPYNNAIFKGELTTNISIPVNKKYEGISANIAINNFYFLDSLIGDVNFGLNETKTNLNILFSLQNNLNNIKSSGTIGKSEYPQPVEFDIDIDISNPGILDVFSFGEISESSGQVTGNAKIGGFINDPLINGFIQFTNANMIINKLNMNAKLMDERINFTNEGVHFDDFTISDSHHNKMIIDGKLLTQDFSDFTFDLKLKTIDFQPVNSTKDDNNVFFGSLIIDTDITLKGDMNLPVIDADITIKQGTDLTYVMPGSEIEIVSSEGVVNFIDPNKKADTIFRATKGDYLTDSLISKVTGIDLNAKLKLNPEAKFTVIIDPYSGDYTSVSGSALLNFSMNPGGGNILTGVFEVTDGIYQLSFYGLVKKTFEFEPGSSIAWSGRLMDANMNFTAKHIVRTQSVALIANESTGMTEAEKNMFKQRLPYEVLLNLKGFLSEPDIDFNIALPEKYLINYPQISSKLTMLNSGQNDSELNKQVFALLVTGSFIADNPFASTGSSTDNFASTAARNSVNGILAGQLNNISSRYIKGVDMNFGLTSYEEFSGNSSELRTELDVQLSKKLMKERLTVEASGSFDVEGTRQYTGTNTSHTYGEFSATYDLTDSREYKMRVYRENAYDLFDGEVSSSGIAFIIEKSFNSLFKRKEDKKE